MSSPETPPPPLPEYATLGSQALAEYADRTMTFYPIEEHELETVSADNARSARAFSIASALLFLGIGLFLEPLFMDLPWEDIGSEVKILVKFVAPALLIISLYFWYDGYAARKKENNTVDRIKKKSKMSYPVQLKVARKSGD